MKNQMIGIGMAALLWMGGSGVAGAAQPIAAKKAALTTTTLRVEGMHCQGCAQGLTGGLKAVKGVSAAKVDHAKKQAVVRYDPALCTPTALVKVVKEAGFTAKVVK